MNRPRLILVVFAGCVTVVLAAMAWVSVAVIESDRRDAQAQRQAELEESARLALWRMDSVLGPFIAREDTRPYYEYSTFYEPPIAFDKEHQPTPGRRIKLPSPLLVQPTPLVKLHFQIDPSGRISSPQTPEGVVSESIEGRLQETGRLEDAAERLRLLAQKIDRKSLLAATLAPGDRVGGPPPTAEDANVSQTQQAAVDAQQWLEELNTSHPLGPSQVPLSSKRVGRARNTAAQQELRSNLEYQQRIASNLQNAVINEFSRFANNRDQQGPAPLDGSASEAARSESANRPAGLAVREGGMKPLWIGGELMLVRQVTIGSQIWIQGCWLDWEGIRTWLLQRISDLLPRAQLVPAVGVGAEADQGVLHLLAAIPIRLTPGSLDSSNDVLSSSIRTSLIVAWACTLLAVAAVIVLVIGVFALSERRAAFVSAVTHELRTPLTTFRMYTQMLADGMIGDDDRRREYLATLQSESNRLAQLVENVLSYARLERRRTASHVEDVAVGEMIDRFRVRLEQRAAQSEMALAIDVDDAAYAATLRTDISAVEQIVYNLVDNACKYAARSEDRRVNLHVEIEPRRVRLCVTDHGPGVGKDVAGRLFRPFSKSVKTAANASQGVGLGLALSRRLARRLGGDLRLARSDSKGCCFELILPRR